MGEQWKPSSGRRCRVSCVGFFDDSFAASHPQCFGLGNLWLRNVRRFRPNLVSRAVQGSSSGLNGNPYPKP